MSIAPTIGDDRDVPAQKIVYVMQQPLSPQGGDEIDVEQLFRILWRRRWQIFIITFACAGLGIAYALLATPFYRADAIVLPRESGPGSGLSAQLSQLGGLAGLAGISVTSGDKQEPLGLLRSKGFARRFIEGNGLLQTLLEDSTSGRSQVIGDASEVQEIRRVVDSFTRSTMSVTEDKKSGLVTVSVLWKDADVAAAWANKLVTQVNDEMRVRALAESEGNIRYLTEQLQSTNLVSIQQSASRLLEAEMQKAMLARGTSEYAFRVIDPAEPPVQRQRPKRTMIAAVAFFAGLMLSLAAVLLAEPLQRVIAAARRA